MLSPPHEIRTLSVLVKVSWKTDVELFQKCAFSHEN